MQVPGPMWELVESPNSIALLAGRMRFGSRAASRRSCFSPSAACRRSARHRSWSGLVGHLRLFAILHLRGDRRPLSQQIRRRDRFMARRHGCAIRSSSRRCRCGATGWPGRLCSQSAAAMPRAISAGYSRKTIPYRYDCGPEARVWVTLRIGDHNPPGRFFPALGFVGSSVRSLGRESPGRGFRFTAPLPPTSVMLNGAAN